MLDDEDAICLVGLVAQHKGGGSRSGDPSCKPLLRSRPINYKAAPERLPSRPEHRLLNVLLALFFHFGIQFQYHCRTPR